MPVQAKPRVVHLTTAHPRKDNRILLRECCTLAEAGYDVNLVVADGLGSETFHGVSIHDAGAKRNRLHRAVVMPIAVQSVALALHPDIVHIHDPELLPIGLLLRLRGYRVIYDSHEDLPRSLMSRTWIPITIRKVVASLAELVENSIVRSLTAVIAATPAIRDRFQSRSGIVQTICNYPRLNVAPEPDYSRREKRTFCYVGAISEDRGINGMLEAARLSGAKLLIAGPFGGSSDEATTRQQPGWKNVEYLGVVPHAEIWSILQRSCAGMLFLHPVQNYIESLPTKMYEYMAVGLPVLASNYAGWPDVVKQNAIGITCNPADPRSIAAAMQQIMDQPDAAEAMGRRARKVVLEKYRWENEAPKLISLYERLLRNSR